MTTPYSYLTSTRLFNNYTTNGTRNNNSALSRSNTFTTYDRERQQAYEYITPLRRQELLNNNNNYNLYNTNNTIYENQQQQQLRNLGDFDAVPIPIDASTDSDDDDTEKVINGANGSLFKQARLIRKKFDQLLTKTSSMVKRSYSLQNSNKNSILNVLPNKGVKEKVSFSKNNMTNSNNMVEQHNISSASSTEATTVLTTNNENSINNISTNNNNNASVAAVNSNDNNNVANLISNNTELIELINDVKNKSKELAESEDIVKENNTLIENNKKKIQLLEVKLLELERNTNEQDKNELKYLLSCTTTTNTTNRFNNQQQQYENAAYQVNNNNNNNNNTTNYIEKYKTGDNNNNMKLMNNYRDVYTNPLINISRETGNLRKEISKLRFEIDGLKFDNSKLTIKTNGIESRINELQCDIGNSLRKSERIQNYISTDDKCYNELKNLIEEIRSTKLMLRNSNNQSVNNSSSYMSPVLYQRSQRDFDSNSGKYHRSSTNNLYSSNDSRQIMPVYVPTATNTYFNPSSYNSIINKSIARGIRNSTDVLNNAYTVSSSYVKPIDYRFNGSYNNISNNNNNNNHNNSTSNDASKSSTNYYQSSFYKSERFDFEPKYSTNNAEYRSHNNTTAKSYSEKENGYQIPIKIDNMQQTTNGGFHSPKNNKDAYLESQSFLVNSKPLLKSELNIKSNEDFLADDTEKQMIKNDYEKLKEEYTKAQSENRELKNKVLDVEKASIDRRKHAELWQTMYNRILTYLPDKEAELIKMSAELEKINIMTDCNLDDSHDADSAEILNSVREIRKIDQENVKKQRETLKGIISRLNEENTHLRIQLEQIKDKNSVESHKITEYSSENAQLKRELHSLKKLQVQEANKAINEVQIKNELENMKLKLEFEINEKEQLKKKYDAELHATRIRCDNEIQRQNQIMQEKYDNFVFEINKLTKEIKEMKDERNQLLNFIEKEKSVNRELSTRLGIHKRPDQQSEIVSQLVHKYESVAHHSDSFGDTKSIDDNIAKGKLKRYHSEKRIDGIKKALFDKMNAATSFSGSLSSSSSPLNSSTNSISHRTKSFATLPWNQEEESTHL